jgi:hypothetical protein
MEQMDRPYGRVRACQGCANGVGQAFACAAAEEKDNRRRVTGATEGPHDAGVDTEVKVRVPKKGSVVTLNASVEKGSVSLESRTTSSSVRSLMPLMASILTGLGP